MNLLSVGRCLVLVSLWPLASGFGPATATLSGRSKGRIFARGGRGEESANAETIRLKQAVRYLQERLEAAGLDASLPSSISVPTTEPDIYDADLRELPFIEKGASELKVGTMKPAQVGHLAGVPETCVVPPSGTQRRQASRGVTFCSQA